jgi:hypothetical protein
MLVGRNGIVCDDCSTVWTVPIEDVDPLLADYVISHAHAEGWTTVGMADYCPSCSATACDRPKATSSG